MPPRSEVEDDTLQVAQLCLPQDTKVLLVDDDELVRDRLSAIVLSAGFEVLTAESAQQALDQLDREFASIVITDSNMPGMDGIAFCRTIRERNYPGYVYVMLLTVKDSEEDILAGLAAGADDYLSKRVSSAQLIARLRTAQRIVTLEQTLRSVLAEKRREAMTDNLTGAYNRAYFNRHLGRELNRTRRFGGDLAVMLLDIDFFKRVNDQHGHGAGDEVLKHFVRIIAKALPRNYDWLARLGGEEFAVVLPQTDVSGATVVAEKVRAAVAATSIPTTAGDLAITVSIGISSLACMPNDEPVTLDNLVELADRYLYKSKTKGRNRVSGPQPASAAQMVRQR